MKNKEVIALYDTLTDISRHIELKLTVRAGYIITKNRRTLEPEAKIIYDERQKILLKYGTPDKDGSILVPKDKIEQANKEINELMDIENDVKVMMIPMEDIEGIELEIGIIEGISNIIKIPEVTGPPIIKNDAEE